VWVLALPAINGIPFFDLFLGSFFGHRQISKEQYVKLKLYGFEGDKTASPSSGNLPQIIQIRKKSFYLQGLLLPSKCIYNLRVFRKTYLYTVVSNDIYGDYFSQPWLWSFSSQQTIGRLLRTLFTIDVGLSNRAVVFPRAHSRSYTNPRLWQLAILWEDRSSSWLFRFFVIFVTSYDG